MLEFCALGVFRTLVCVFVFVYDVICSLLLNKENIDIGEKTKKNTTLSEIPELFCNNSILKEN